MIRTIAAEAMGGRELFTGPVSLIVLMTLQPAASWSAKKRAAARFVVGKPDPDNSLKLFDAINGIVWRDDSQICDVLFRRRYSIFEAESVRVWIADAEDDLVMPEVPQFARAPIDDPLPLFRRIRKRRAAA